MNIVTVAKLNDKNDKFNIEFSCSFITSITPTYSVKIDVYNRVLSENSPCP